MSQKGVFEHNSNEFMELYNNRRKKIFAINFLTLHRNTLLPPLTSSWFNPVIHFTVNYWKTLQCLLQNEKLTFSSYNVSTTSEKTHAMADSGKNKNISANISIMKKCHINEILGCVVLCWKRRFVHDPAMKNEWTKSDSFVLFLKKFFFTLPLLVLHVVKTKRKWRGEEVLCGELAVKKKTNLFKYSWLHLTLRSLKKCLSDVTYVNYSRLACHNKFPNALMNVTYLMKSKDENVYTSDNHKLNEICFTMMFTWIIILHSFLLSNVAWSWKDRKRRRMISFIKIKLWSLFIKQTWDAVSRIDIVNDQWLTLKSCVTSSSFIPSKRRYKQMSLIMLRLLHKTYSK